MKRGGYIKRYTAPATVNGIWNTNKADGEFSDYIIGRDKCCLVCSSKHELTCSHFYNRYNSSTRYDPANCICLCKKCHSLWEPLKNPGQAYHTFMEHRLGNEAFYLLTAKSRTIMKRDEAIQSCMLFLSPFPNPHVLEEIEI